MAINRNIALRFRLSSAVHIAMCFIKLTQVIYCIECGTVIYNSFPVLLASSVVAQQQSPDWTDYPAKLLRIPCPPPTDKLNLEYLGRSLQTEKLIKLYKVPSVSRFRLRPESFRKKHIFFLGYVTFIYEET